MSKHEHDAQARYVRDQITQLVAARRAAGLDMTDVMLRTGWAMGTVRRFESNTTNPTLMQIMVYTHAIGGDWEHLVSVEGALDNG